MAVFKAGPWGTFNDPYQPRPDVVSGKRDFGDPDIGVYPINVANNTFGWRSFWSAKIGGVCCTPETVSITGAYLSSMTNRDFPLCDYFESYGGTPPTYFDYYTQRLYYSEGTWFLVWSSAFFIGDAYLVKEDSCDPTGTYTDIYGGSPTVSLPP